MAATWKKRKSIPIGIETQVLTESRRRCCLCFHLNGKTDVKSGQIAHIDRNRTNHAESNLAFLCLEHHNEYDAKRIQSKGFTPSELRHAKRSLYEDLQKRQCDDRVSVAITVEADFNELTETERRLLLDKICALAEVKRGVLIRHVERSSIRFAVEMNVDDAAKLTKAFNSGRLSPLAVSDVRLDSRPTRRIVFSRSFDEYQFNNTVSREQALEVTGSPDCSLFLNEGKTSSQESAKVGLYLKKITAKYSILIITQRATEVVAAFPLNHELIDIEPDANPISVLKSFLSKVGLESLVGNERALLRIGEIVPLPVHVNDAPGFLQYCQKPVVESREPFVCINVLTHTGATTIGIEILFYVSAVRYYPWLASLGRPTPPIRDSFFFSPLSD